MPNTAILFIVFNRPDLTTQVFEKIKLAKPSRFFVAADGPRVFLQNDQSLCEETRKIVLDNIDWPCEVFTLLQKENLGCKKAVSGAINWFFEHVEEGIILEDDCLPDISFFNFCSTLLERFRNDETIFHISGSNFQFSEVGNGSYYLSKIPHIWGWASWRRAWKYYDVELKNFDATQTSTYFNDLEIDLYWKKTFTKTQNKEIDTWDYQWGHTLLYHKKYAILPQYNLVKNIGFDERGSRTQYKNDKFANLKTYNISPIVHPQNLCYKPFADIIFHHISGMKYTLYSKYISGKMSLKILTNKFSYSILKKNWFDI